jgi:TolA-binding protein
MKRLAHMMLIALLLAGCTSSPDERLVQMAKEHEKRQAEQSQQMARLQQEVAEGSKRLVEADAQAREELAAMQQAMRVDQTEIGHQRDQLETERREIATQRNRDPILAAAIMNIGLVLACLLPLVVCVYVLWSVGKGRQEDEAVTELLVQELVSQRPKLLPPPGLPALMYETAKPAGEASAGSSLPSSPPAV